MESKNVIDWKKFMEIAFLEAKKSKDPVTQVGACIVTADNKIVGVGYNEMPRGCDKFPWNKQKNSLEPKLLYVCHAEMNAIVNRDVFDVKGCKMFVTLFPCNECAKLIIQSGIKEVIYASDEKAHKLQTMASKRMFDSADVHYRQYQSKANEEE